VRTKPPPGSALQLHDNVAAADLLDQIADVYVEARAEPPYDTNPAIWSREAFVDRTRQQVRNPGFVLVTAHIHDELVGFAFGLPFESGRWFRGSSEPPAEILAATKFAVIELNVRKPWRRRGIGRALLDELLDGRPEGYAMLTSLPEAAAYRMYERWGWRPVATMLPESGLPPWGTLVFPLQPGP
jgi:GNAT superfamily N-acetyltransferase